MRTKILKIAIVTTVLLFAFFFGLYLIGSNSEAYKVAEVFVKNNNEIPNEFGKITDIRLAFLGYSVSYSGPKGKADFEIIIFSNSKKGSVYVNLEKVTGEWIINNARLKENGKDFVNLNSPKKIL